jgi:hypothetical protein
VATITQPSSDSIRRISLTFTHGIMRLGALGAHLAA